MNSIAATEKAGDVFGAPGRFFNVVRADNGRILNQTFRTVWREFTEHKERYRVQARLRFDDEYHNGHETFSITGETQLYNRALDIWREDSGGCIHDVLARHFPELAPLIKWHLVSTDGPMHYIANTIYLAGDRDCHGLRVGESRQIRNRKTGEPCWRLGYAADSPAHKVGDYVDGARPAILPGLEWQPLLRIGEGKARDLAAARSTAVWPDATDAELMQEPDALRAALAARLPALLAAFQADMRAAGFLWPEGAA